MNNKKTILLYILLILISSFSVLGSYDRLGQTTQDYQVDYSVFGDEETVITATGVIENINGDTFPPLVFDLDNDGIEEIIIIDGAYLSLYHNKTLSAIDGISHGLTSPLSNPEIFDIDGDGNREIIIAGANQEIHTYGFNGTSFNVESSNVFVWAGYSGGSMLVRCRDTNECLLVVQDQDTRSATDFRAFVFGTGGVDTNFNIETTASTDEYNCFSKNPNIMLGNLDDEGDKEYIFSSVLVDIAGSEIFKIYTVWVNNTDPTDAGVYWEKTIRTNGVSNEQSCGVGLYENWFSSVVVDDLYKANGDLDEIAIAYLHTANEIRILIISPSGSTLYNYPSVLSYFEGSTISNPIIIDYHPDTSEKDVCVASQNGEYNLNLYCTAQRTGLFGSNSYFTFEGANYFNLSNEYKSYKSLIHYQEKDNINELYTTWGLYSITNLNNDELCTSDYCTMPLLWATTKSNGSMISASFEGANADVLVRDDTNIWYLDDNFINTPAQIIELSYNPCITDDIIKVNSTIQINVKVDDINGDDVNARAVLYYGESYNQTYNYTVTNRTHGSTFTFAFIATNILNNAVLKVCGRDTVNINIEDCKEINFNVASEGVVYGDTNCQESFSLLDEDDLIDDDTPKLTDLPKSILPEETIPSNYYPLISLLIIALVSIGVVILLSQNDIKDGKLLLSAGLSSAFLVWLALIFVGMIPSYTLVVGVVFGAFALGIITYNKSQGG